VWDAVCCSMLQCVAECFAVRHSVMQRVAMMVAYSLDAAAI